MYRTVMVSTLELLQIPAVTAMLPRHTDIYVYRICKLPIVEIRRRLLQKVLLLAARW
jgi:hypothetical protein